MVNFVGNDKMEGKFYGNGNDADFVGTESSWAFFGQIAIMKEIASITQLSF